jgi:hypothetical protein
MLPTIYQMQEGYLALAGPWQDQSVNVLVPEQPHALFLGDPRFLGASAIGFLLNWPQRSGNERT